MRFLGGEYGFQIWEMYSNDDLAGGLLVFNTFLDAYKFCRQQVQCIFLKFDHVWYEIVCGEIATRLLNDIQLALNEDCIDEIAKHLGIVEFADLFLTCKSTRLKKIADRRFVNLVITPKALGNKFGLMNLCYILHVLGDIIENITVSLHSFRGGHRTKWNSKLMYSILYHICNMTGRNLRSISLQHFEIDMNNSYYRSLFNTLQLRNVVINMNVE